MWKIIFEFLDTLVNASEPLKTILISWILSIMTCTSVILIGAGVEKLEQLEFKALNAIFSKKMALFIEDRLTFPGTMLHECSHVLFAWITGAKIQKVRLLTFFDAHRLGYVIFAPRGNKLQRRVQLAFSSSAPVIMGITELSVIIKIWTYFDLTFGWKCLLVYLFISIFNHMSMSVADIKNYCRGLISVFPVVFLIFYAIRFYAFR